MKKVYKKFNGSYIAFLGVAVAIVSLIISVILYVMVDPSFSPSTHFISNLGEGPNYSNYVFSYCEIATGTILGCFFLYLTLYLQKMNGNKVLTWVSFIFGLIGSIGLMIAGAFPMYTNTKMHILGAALFFGGVVFFCMTYGVSELLIREVPRKYPLIGLIPLLFNSLFIFFSITNNTNFHISWSMYLITEWIAYFTAFAWILGQGIFTLKE